MMVGLFTLLLFATFAFVQKSEKEENKQHSTTTDDKGFAVLELFTSEGCSSCPPADELMGRIGEEYKNETVYILSYHVDYWNRLGWKDRFSSAEHSQRQQMYSHILGSQVYTPQLVINGKTEFVGSDETAINKTLQKALFSSQNTHIDLSAKVTQNEIKVQYDASATDPKNVLWVNLRKGENEGRHLQHWQIVHKQNQIALHQQSKGTTSFKVPEQFSSDKWEIIAFIQNPKTGEILGTAKANFNQQ